MTLSVSDWPFGHLPPDKASDAARLIAEADLEMYCSNDFLIREFKRYLLVRIVLNRPVTMQARMVDGVWHAFILDTANYRRFCKAVFGAYLDHESAHFPLDEQFGPTYELLFGEELPEVWLHEDYGDNGNCA